MNFREKLEAALIEETKEIDGQEGVICQAALRDAVSDLCHLAHKYDLSLGQALEGGLAVYEEEIKEENQADNNAVDSAQTGCENHV